MKVLFITNIPSPYRVDFFNELGKQCDLTVIFERSASAERDASWRNYGVESFAPIILQGLQWGADGAFCPGICKYLKIRQYDHVIVSDFTSPTGMLAISHMRRKKIPYWLESDGGFAKNGLGWKEKLKTSIMKGAAGYFSTAKEHDRYYLQYGAEHDRIFRYPFSSLHSRDLLTVPVSKQEQSILRNKLRMQEEKIVLSVGQFIHRKGFDVLLEAMTRLPKNVGCYFVGGQPTEEYLQLVESHHLDHVHFVGFCNKTALAKYYQAADLFVLPTREDIWGLVINEAMANGLPVITTDRCIAGLELVQDGENGYIVPAGDAQILADRMKVVLEDETVLSRMRVRSLRRIAGYTVEKMAERHMEILNNN